MRVLSIGTDRKLFENKNAVLARNLEYASKMDELYIIVFSLKKLGLEPFHEGNLHILPTNSVSRLCYVFDAIKLGKKIITNNKFNATDSVITTQDPFETGLVGYFLRRKFGLPLQLQVHTDFLSSYFRNSFLNSIRVIIAKFLIPRAQGLRVVSEPIKTSIIINFLNLKMIPKVLPIFVDVEKIINIKPTKNIKNNFPQFSFIILMGSRLSKEKRIDIALQAFKKVTNQIPHAGLVIAGDGSEKVYLEKLARKLGLAGSVVFIGQQNELVSYYKTADLFLLTSEYEGYGMTLIEAGASGCPIVTTKVGIANTDLFVNGGNSFVCPINDAECLFMSIHVLLVHKGKKDLFKKEMQDSIRKIATTKEEYVARYIGLLENLIQK